MSNNIKVVLGMKFYPYHIINGNMVKLTDDTIKMRFDKKYKSDLVKYFSKHVALRINDEGKLRCFADGHIVGIAESRTEDFVTVEVLIEKHSILNRELHNKYKS